MDMKYDTVIIGAGPAGAACGITLRKQGASVCAVDRAVFPRNKTCAGLVTAKTFGLINNLFDGEVTDKLFCDSTYDIKLFRKNREISSAVLDSKIRLVEREHFDNALVERYRELGGVLFEGESGIEIDHDKNIVRLSDGREIGYKNLVYSDGVLSMSRRLIKTDNRKLAFGVEVHIPKEKLPVDSVNLHFEYLGSGYIWVFPHGDTVCVGAADRYRNDNNIKSALTGFLTELGIDCEGMSFKGAFLPYGYIVPQNKLPENVMLAGDAGGFADPISGEGLYMSMRTGIYAAEAIMTKNPKQTYLEKTKRLRRIVRDGKKVQDIMYKPSVHKKLLTKAEGNSRILKFYYENVVDEYKYEYRGLRRFYSDYKKGKE